ncbi:nuclear transport factor 2 family protein [Mycobacterium hodleri]|uniref:nuclear transport factor 2 family protein n=1 Tax=Mycolicibacterium hodleri TaxID=49897 RepID=UPI0021F31AA9|nr:nuclear transport factor 2 family protein [Mycolicibacterium hodleri]MCV7137350.1 nuclear transport factor 2 family protein [Mycolicibacterium hodleri]
MTTTTSAPVDSFFRATNAHDSAALLATFAQDAVLYNADEGTYRGHQDIKVWDDKEFVGAQCTVAVQDTITTGKGEIIVTGDTRGTFPGGQIILYFLFTVEDDLITALTIHH